LPGPSEPALWIAVIAICVAVAGPVFLLALPRLMM
jgi:hypothetical protein